MLIVGLTGGIATGKSTVADMFRQAGAHIVDADRIAHQVVAPGQPAWAAIRDTFGSRVFQPDGIIDRARLGAVVFADALLRKKLEEIIHPLVWRGMADAMDYHRQKHPGGLVILDIPLLMETGRHASMTEVILVYAPEAIQLQRLMRRDGIDRRAARERIASQMPIEQKRSLATIIIDNSGSRAQTQTQVSEVYGRLSRRAAQVTI